MLPLAAAVIAIVTQDLAALRASASSTAPRSAVLYQGDSLEVRGARAGFVQVYDYHRERGGYVLEGQVRQYPLATTSAAALLENVRLLRDVPGLESLGIAHAALHLKLAAARELTAEPFDALGTMAERLARRASSRFGRPGEEALAGQLEVARSFGLRLVPIEGERRTRTCYDGEAFRQVLRLGGSAEALARAGLGLTDPGCETGSPGERHTQHEWAAQTLASLPIETLPSHVQSRVRLRRVAVWSALAFERARVGRLAEAQAAGAEAIRELTLVPRGELAESDRGEYTEAALRAAASRPASDTGSPSTGRLAVAVTPRSPGETCLSLAEKSVPQRVLVERCTFGQLWPASVRVSPRGDVVTAAVQLLAAWRELWVLRAGVDGRWVADVVVPAGETGVGYVEWAGFSADGKALLAVRETLVDGRLERSFELIDAQTLAVTRSAQRPQDLTAFHRWQSPEWRSQTLALR